MRSKIQNTRALLEAINGTEIYSCKENGPIISMPNVTITDWQLTAHSEPVDVAGAANAKL